MPRTVASDVSVTLFGVMNLSVDLLPTVESRREASYKLCCPACSDAIAVKQEYWCTAVKEHGPFTTGDCDRAKEIAKALFKVTEEEVAEVKKSQLPEKEMTVEVFPAAQVESMTITTGKSYRLRAERNLSILAMLIDLVRDESKAFVGELNLSRTGQKLYRLQVWNGNLLLVELARPDDVVQTEPTVVDYDKRLLDTAKKFVEVATADFDPEQYKNSVRERALALIAAKEQGAPAPVAATPKTNSTDALLDVLQKSLDALKGE